MELTTVKDLTPVITRTPPQGGIQAIFRFENGYGASVINHSGSYGVELAVLRFTGEGTDDWELCYTTPITDDVIGWIQDENELFGYLTGIRRLPVPLTGSESDAPALIEDGEGEDTDDDDDDEWDEEFGPYADEEEAFEAFDSMLDECYPEVEVCGYSFQASRALKELDPIAYRCEFVNWLDSELSNR